MLSFNTTNTSSSPADSSLEDFLSQFVSKTPSKLESIHQTIHKAETQCSTPQRRTEKSITFKHEVLNQSDESLLRSSNQTTQTEDTMTKRFSNDFSIQKGF